MFHLWYIYEIRLRSMTTVINVAMNSIVPVAMKRRVSASLSPGGIACHITVSQRVIRGATLCNNSSNVWALMRKKLQ